MGNLSWHPMNNVHRAGRGKLQESKLQTENIRLGLGVVVGCSVLGLGGRKAADTVHSARCSFYGLGLMVPTVTTPNNPPSKI